LRPGQYLFESENIAIIPNLFVSLRPFYLIAMLNRLRRNRVVAKLFCCFLIVVFASVLIADEKLPEYPVSHRIEQIDTYNGVEVTDPYRWLEETNSVQVTQWRKAQDQLFADYVQGFKESDAIRGRLASLWHFDFYSTPIKANNAYFFTKTPEGQIATSLYYQRFNQSPELIFNPESLGPDRNISGFQPSPDGRSIVCFISTGQSRWREIRIVSGKGHLQQDSLKGLHTLSGPIAWSADSSGFYYIAFEQPEEGSENLALVQNPKIHYHRLGTTQSVDRLIYASESADSNLTAQTSEDGRYLVITEREGGSSKNKILYSDLSSPDSVSKELVSANAAYTYLGNNNSEFYLYTDMNAPNGRIISINLERPDMENWNIVLPESKESIAAGSLVGGNAVGYYGNRFVILYWKNATPVLKSFDKQGRLEHSIELPEGSSIWGGISGNATDPEVFYALLTLTRPRTVYRLNLTTGKSDVFRSVEKDFRSEDFVTKQVFYKSKDGTRIPMFIVHKKGMTLNGSNPLFLYGYGAFGWNSFLWYQPNVLVWLERGGIYALPRIRGGGEYGESWHQAGVKRNKRNTIDDYLSAAEWLIENRYTSAEKLVANGGSASGFLAAIAVMKRPDLFGAALIDIPFLDLLRYDKFTGGRSFIPEFGSTEDPEEFQFLHSISPYHNIRSGQCYPPMLVRVGELDQTAVPMHGYKFIAAMQAAQKCANPILLKVMRGAGHNFGATPEQNIASSTEALAFLLRTLN
jgi:prolyl oligopeptidase